MYADDIQFYRSTFMENVNHCVDSINCVLPKVDNCAKAIGLCINPSKSKCLLFSSTKRAFVASDIIIRGNRVDFVESATN